MFSASTFFISQSTTTIVQKASSRRQAFILKAVNRPWRRFVGVNELFAVNEVKVDLFHVRFKDSKSHPCASLQRNLQMA